MLLAATALAPLYARRGGRGRQHLQFAPLRHRPAALGRLHQGDRHPGQRRRRHPRAADPADAERGRQQPGRRLHHRRRRPARLADRPACCSRCAPRCWRPRSPSTCAIPTASGSAWPSARVLVYAKDRVDPSRSAPTRRWPIRSSRARSSSAAAPTSTISAWSARSWRPTDRRATEAWCEGLVANMARPPEGGDTDQIKAVAAGVGDVAI